MTALSQAEEVFAEGDENDSARVGEEVGLVSWNVTLVEGDRLPIP